MTLTELRPGQRGKILKIQAPGVIKRRLMDMGVIVGESVYVEKIAPFGDPIEIRVKNYSLSLRRSESDKIQVEAS